MGDHSWEDPLREHGSLHSWELESPMDMGSMSDVSEQEDAMEPEDIFIQHCTEMLLLRDLNATQFAHLMYYAGNAGLGKSRKLGMPPGKPSGHYSRKVRRHIGRHEDRKEMYLLPTTCFYQAALARAERHVPVFVPHEQLYSDAVSEEMRTRLREAITNEELPRSYYEHPLVRQYNTMEDPMLPLNVYMDGVPYSHTDSVIGIFIENFISGQRYAIGVIRKKLLCRCGCRGFCSINAILSFVAWSFRCMRDGYFPSRRHDETPWVESDHLRAEWSGEPMFRAILLYVKSDWAELSSTVGFPSWNDGVRPCPCCNASGDRLYDHEGSSATAFPHRENKEGEYAESCARCEIIKDMAREERMEVLQRGDLAYDRKTDGSRGRALGRNIDEWELAKNDRIEPSVDLPDPGQFENRPGTIRITWWRPSRETMARHRCPLFSEAVWRIFDTNVFKPPNSSHEELSWGLGLDG